MIYAGNIMKLDNQGDTLDANLICLYPEPGKILAPF